MVFLLILNEFFNCLEHIPFSQHNLLEAFIDDLLFNSIQRSLIVHAIQFEIAFEVIALFCADLFDELDEGVVVALGFGCLLEDVGLDVLLSLVGGDVGEVNLGGSVVGVGFVRRMTEEKLFRTLEWWGWRMCLRDEG